MRRTEGIDIIIPIYNAFDDLQRCIASVLTCTDLTRHRILLINDASPDERFRPYIDSLASDRIIVIENKKNIGFSGSINRGIQVSEHRDVILLNSDTLVTPRWVDKLVDCAYEEASIATVTPLSNNATLCSVPEFLNENSLPEGYSLEQYAELIEKFSMKLYPRIPVANGFCMYIKREVINRIGQFDMETFGRGYGEENDFCYRAEQVGYHHVMCDDTYIYHAGSSSFISEEKRRLIKLHEKILDERYPKLNHAVAVHCRDNPNEPIQENIKIWTTLHNGKKNILYLVQSDFREDAHDHLGGTQLHVKDMTELMRRECNVFVAARNTNYLNFTAYTNKEEITFQYYIGDAPEYPEFRSKQFAELYGRLLDTFEIDLVHIHHTKGLTLEMYYQADIRNIPIVTTMHDYYAICPSIKMVNCHGELCIGNSEKECCRECQKNFGGVWENTDYISVWREEHRNALELSKAFVTPSDSARRIIERYYPELAGKIRVIPHGMQPMSCENKADSDKFHVAFIGGISKEKGSYTSYQLIKNGPSDVEWYLFGVWGYNELSMLEKKNYTKTGLYERHELPGLVEKYQIDLICILPIWPETYCYTLSEAIMCGAPVITTDIGALGERMKELKCGWTVSVERAYEEALEIILRVKDKGPEYQKKKELVQAMSVKSLEEMKAEYWDLYNELLSVYSEHNQQKVCVQTEKLYKSAVDAYRLAHGKKMCLETEGERMQERLTELEAQLAGINNWFAFKCACVLSSLPIPGKKYIKKVLYMGYRLIKR